MRESFVLLPNTAIEGDVVGPSITKCVREHRDGADVRLGRKGRTC